MTTWQVQLTTLESRATEHEQFSQQLVTNLAEPLKQLAARYEELRKFHGDYAAKLEKERDSTYNDLKKQKGKYDNACSEVESRRKKSDGAFDHGKAKARAAFEQQQADMRNIKVGCGNYRTSRIALTADQSTYIISINVTNKQKERYYHEYVPGLLDVRFPELHTLWSLP